MAENDLSVSVMLTTYNQPEFLEMSLLAYDRQQQQEVVEHRTCRGPPQRSRSAENVVNVATQALKRLEQAVACGGP